MSAAPTQQTWTLRRSLLSNPSTESTRTSEVVGVVSGGILTTASYGKCSDMIISHASLPGAASSSFRPPRASPFSLSLLSEEGAVVTCCSVVRHDVGGHTAIVALVGTSNGSMLVVDTMIDARVLAVAQFPKEGRAVKGYDVASDHDPIVSFAVTVASSSQLGSAWYSESQTDGIPVGGLSSRFSRERHCDGNVFVRSIEIVHSTGWTVTIYGAAWEALMQQTYVWRESGNPYFAAESWPRPSLRRHWANEEPPLAFGFPFAGTDSFGHQLCEGRHIEVEGCRFELRVQSADAVLLPDPSTFSALSALQTTSASRNQRSLILAYERTADGLPDIVIAPLASKPPPLLSTGQMALKVAGKITGAALRVVKGFWGTSKRDEATESASSKSHCLGPSAPAHATCGVTAPKCKFRTISVCPRGVHAAVAGAERVYIVDMVIGCVVRIFKGCRGAEVQWILHKDDVLMVIVSPIRGSVELYSMKSAGCRIAAMRVKPISKLVHFDGRTLSPENDGGTFIIQGPDRDLAIVHLHSVVKKELAEVPPTAAVVNVEPSEVDPLQGVSGVLTTLDNLTATWRKMAPSMVPPFHCSDRVAQRISADIFDRLFVQQWCVRVQAMSSKASFEPLQSLEDVDLSTAVVQAAVDELRHIVHAWDAWIRTDAPPKRQKGFMLSKIADPVLAQGTSMRDTLAACEMYLDFVHQWRSGPGDCKENNVSEPPTSGTAAGVAAAVTPPSSSSSFLFSGSFTSWLPSLAASPPLSAQQRAGSDDVHTHISSWFSLAAACSSKIRARCAAADCKDGLRTLIEDPSWEEAWSHLKACASVSMTASQTARSFFVPRFETWMACLCPINPSSPRESADFAGRIGLLIEELCGADHLSDALRDIGFLMFSRLCRETDWKCVSRASQLHAISSQMRSLGLASDHVSRWLMNFILHPDIFPSIDIASVAKIVRSVPSDVVLERVLILPVIALSDAERRRLHISGRAAVLLVKAEQVQHQRGVALSSLLVHALKWDTVGRGVDRFTVAMPFPFHHTHLRAFSIVTGSPVSSSSASNYGVAMRHFTDIAWDLFAAEQKTPTQLVSLVAKGACLLADPFVCSEKVLYQPCFEYYASVCSALKFVLYLQSSGQECEDDAIDEWLAVLEQLVATPTSCPDGDAAERGCVTKLIVKRYALVASLMSQVSVVLGALRSALADKGEVVRKEAPFNDVDLAGAFVNGRSGRSVERYFATCQRLLRKIISVFCGICHLTAESCLTLEEVCVHLVQERAVADDRESALASSESSCNATHPYRAFPYLSESLRSFALPFACDVFAQHQFDTDAILLTLADVLSVVMFAEWTRDLDHVEDVATHTTISIPWVDMFAIPALALMAPGTVFPQIPIELVASHSEQRHLCRLQFVCDVVDRVFAPKAAAGSSSFPDSESILRERVTPLSRSLDLDETRTTELWHGAVAAMHMKCFLEPSSATAWITTFQASVGNPDDIQRHLLTTPFAVRCAEVVLLFLRRYLHAAIKWFASLERSLPEGNRELRVRHANGSQHIRSSMSSSFQEWLRSKSDATTSQAATGGVSTPAAWHYRRPACDVLVDTVFRGHAGRNQLAPLFRGLDSVCSTVEAILRSGKRSSPFASELHVALTATSTAVLAFC